MSKIKEHLNWITAGASILALILAFTAVVNVPTVAPSASALSNTNQIEDQLVALYHNANPSVVSIQVREPATAETSQQMPTLPQIPGFPQFQFPQQQQQDQYVYGQGSGFVYDTAGHIVTNFHVAGNADQIQVIFADGTSLDATLVGGDPDSDLAVVKVDPSKVDLQPLAIGNSDDLSVGDMVAAIGNPFGLEGSMTSGIVSALGRMLPSQAQMADGSRFNITDLIQTDAAINPGNSGGPLLNLAGEVVGVNTAIESSNSQYAGIGFAVPSNAVARVVPALIDSGRYEHAWLGIAGRTLTADFATAMNLDATQTGVLVATVQADSPASRANLRGSSTDVTIQEQTTQVGGDVIVSVNGNPINNFDDLLNFITNDASVGQTITLGILRGGETINVDVTLAARPTSTN
jgi:serine protease Do